VTCRDKRVEKPSGMLQRSEAGRTETVGLGGYTMNVLFSGMSQTKKGLVLDRGFSKEHMVQVAVREFRLMPIREK
jgi:hypothetical protein